MNVFSAIPTTLPNELSQSLLETKSFRIERIVSHGHASAAGFWYDQEQAEWILVLSGEAVVRFEDRDEPVVMKPGDYVNIAAHCKHRVEWTTPESPTIWLAVHYA
jgi:cupin 2 domain-containing protein